MDSLVAAAQHKVGAGLLAEPHTSLLRRRVSTSLSIALGSHGMAGHRAELAISLMAFPCAERCLGGLALQLEVTGETARVQPTVGYRTGDGTAFVMLVMAIAEAALRRQGFNIVKDRAYPGMGRANACRVYR